MPVGTTPSDLVRLLAAHVRHRPVGLMFDYDGTLADIQPRPDLAHMDDETRRELGELARLPRVRLAILTGRSEEGSARSPAHSTGSRSRSTAVCASFRPTANGCNPTWSV